MVAGTHSLRQEASKSDHKFSESIFSFAKILHQSVVWPLNLRMLNLSILYASVKLEPRLSPKVCGFYAVDVKSGSRSGPARQVALAVNPFVTLVQIIGS
jgi:hypothetical protein